MKNELETIDLAQLDNVAGGSRGQVIKKAAGWAWRNVIAPLGGGALYDWATGGGGNNQQQPPPQQPAPQQPPRN